jgi:filamentous hemagglutinin
VARAVIGTAINGGSFEENLREGIKGALLDTVAAQGANAIGDLTLDGALDGFANTVAHAIAGCMVGAARADSASGCGAGALGAAIGELAAEAYGRRDDTVQFAALVSGLAVAVTGGDASQINIGSQAGGNAAANNYLNHADASRLMYLHQFCKASMCSEAEVDEWQLLKAKDLKTTAAFNACAGDFSERCIAIRADFQAASHSYLPTRGEVLVWSANKANESGGKFSVAEIYEAYSANVFGVPPTLSTGDLNDAADWVRSEIVKEPPLSRIAMGLATYQNAEWAQYFGANVAANLMAQARSMARPEPLMDKRPPTLIRNGELLDSNGNLIGRQNPLTGMYEPVLGLPSSAPSVIRNALSPKEFRQASDIVQFRGGTFVGPRTSNFPGIDGWLDGVPVQLKSLEGRSIYGVLRNVIHGAKDMAAEGYRGDIYIDASSSGISMTKLIEFIKPGSPISDLTAEGTVQHVYIKTAEGWLTVTSGAISIPKH